MTPTDELYNVYTAKTHSDPPCHITIAERVSRETLLRVLADDLPRKTRAGWLKMGGDFAMVVGARTYAGALLVERIQ